MLRYCVMALCLLSVTSAFAYGVKSDWSYVDEDGNGHWDPGEDQWWDYYFKWDPLQEEPPFHFGVFVAPSVTDGMLDRFDILTFDGESWNGSWEYAVEPGPGPDYATRVLWTFKDKLPEGVIFRFHDCLKDPYVLYNEQGPLGAAWDTQAKETTVAVWGEEVSSKTLFEHTGDFVAAAPEPGTVALVIVGLGGLGFVRQRKKARQGR